MRQIYCKHLPETLIYKIESCGPTKNFPTVKYKTINYTNNLLFIFLRVLSVRNLHATVEMYISIQFIHPFKIILYGMMSVFLQYLYTEFVLFQQIT